MKKWAAAAGIVCTLLPSLASAQVISLAPSQPAVRTLQHVSRRTLRKQMQALFDARATMRAESDIPLKSVYQSSDYNLSIRYPDQWQQKELQQKSDNLTLLVMFLSPLEGADTVRENVNVVIEDTASTPVSLQQYSALGIQKEEAFFTSFHLFDSEDVTIAGRPAHRVTYTATFQRQTLKFRQVWMLRGTQAFVWTFADTPEFFDAHVGIFERMLGTLTM